jgi:glutathione reductase (NADPH)
MSHDCDLIVIGAGSGGVRAARLAAQRGQRVVVIEADRPGGTCVLRGCVPKKLLVYASEVPALVQAAHGYGWPAAAGALDWPALRDHIHADVGRISEVYQRNLLATGATLVQGRARFVDAHTLAVGDEQYHAPHILIAVGGVPRRLAGFAGAEHAITSDEMFTLDRLPQSAVIVGSGFIALEFACILRGFGAAVSVVLRGAGILRGFDDELTAALHDQMVADGIRFFARDAIARIDRTAEGLSVHLKSGAVLDSDLVLSAIGRDPNTADLGLDAAGVATDDAGAVVVDRFSQTSMPHIYAVGDVTNRLNLTPVAIREGVAFVETVYGGVPTAFDHTDVPVAVFTQPELASVGLPEADARAQYGDVHIYKTRFKPMKSAFAGSDARVLMKLVVDGTTDRVLGCHILSPGAGELIQAFGIAVKAGLTKAQWDATCAVHPTMAEEMVALRERS